MSAPGVKLRMVSQLKRAGPIYRCVRAVRRRSRRLIYDVLRCSLPSWPRLGPARGLFHAYDELRTGRLDGEILLERQTIVPSPDGSLKILAKLGQAGYQPWPVFWTRHDHARLIGEAALLVDHHKRACAEAVYLHLHDGDPGYNALWLPMPIRLSGNWTSVISRWPTNYYHWFTDCLTRLALLERMPADTKILVPHELQPFQKETLRWLGLTDRIVPLPGRHLMVDHYYFSSPTVMMGCANPYGVQFLREKFLPRADASFHGPEKIYIRRRDKSRGIRNETDVIAFLEMHGWQAVDLESLTLAQQIHLFAHARAVCGLHGAGFTNLLWCRPGCVAVELLAENFLNGCYEALAGCLAVEHRFLVMPGDEQSRIQVNLDQLGKLLPI